MSDDIKTAALFTLHAEPEPRLHKPSQTRESNRSYPDKRYDGYTEASHAANRTRTVCIPSRTINQPQK
jgi:hypothetical protein